MGKLKERSIFLLVCMLLAAALAACAPAGGENRPPKPKEGVLTYAALNPMTRAEKRNIEVFNKNHPDAQIEVLDYSDEGGVDRLLTELALGRVPDIMQLRRLGGSRVRDADLERVGLMLLNQGDFVAAGIPAGGGTAAGGVRATGGAGAAAAGKGGGRQSARHQDG